MRVPHICKPALTSHIHENIKTHTPIAFVFQ